MNTLLWLCIKEISLEICYRERERERDIQHNFIANDLASIQAGCIGRIWLWPMAHKNKKKAANMGIIFDIALGHT